MKILKHGNTWKVPLYGKCLHCFCQFVMDSEEAKENEFPIFTDADKYYINCPECGGHVTLTRKKPDLDELKEPAEDDNKTYRYFISYTGNDYLNNIYTGNLIIDSDEPIEEITDQVMQKYIEEIQYLRGLDRVCILCITPVKIKN